MNSTLLVGKPASGKTAACIEKIRSVQNKKRLSLIWVLVPDAQKGAYFRSRLAPAGGGLGISVGTFGDLYRDILERNGTFVPVISQALGHRLIQETVNDVYSSGKLAYFGAIRDKPGFLLSLQDAFAELRGAYVRPEQFLAYAQSSPPAHYELSALYDHFLTRLQTLKWIDQEGQSWLAIDALEKNTNAAAHLGLVVVDGFTSFTGVRRQFLKLLGQQVEELTITLPGSTGSSRPVHRRSALVIDSLVSELSMEVQEIGSTPRLAQPILHMEQHALDPGNIEEMETGKPLMLEARSHSEEAREALRWIKELNIRQKIPLDACAVFAGNLDVYQPLLRAAANEFGIKIHFTRADPLTESPSVQAILSLLLLPLENFPTRTLLNTLHSPYFNFGLDGKNIDDLEKVSQQAIIVSGREQWEAAWTMLEKSRSISSETLDDDRQGRDLTAGIDIPSLRKQQEKFWSLFSLVGDKRSQAGWVGWLEKLLEGLEFYNRVSSDRDLEACRSLGDALKALVISEKVAGIRETDYAHFISDLQGALNGARVAEDRQSRAGSLLAGRVVEARASRFQAVVLLGLSEGLFPAVENPDPFLDEQLREDLGLEPRLNREQASIFYQAFTRADTHLLLTRPYLSEDGEPWEASPYWLSVQKLFSKNAVVKIIPGAVRPQVDAASTQELLFWGMQQGKLLYPEDDELSQRWQTLEKARAVLDSRRARAAGGFFEGNVGQITNSLAEHYDGRYRWSASRLEEYSSCPFKSYINSILKLTAKATPEPGLDVSQIGSIYHRILELVYSQVMKDGVKPLEILDKVAGGVLQGAPEEFQFRPSPLWEVEKAQYLENLRRTLSALEDECRDWTPVELEAKFGLEGAPALKLNIGEETIHLVGLIDRVDRNSRGEIRVVDYKLGSTRLEKADLINGQRLQLPIYALAAQAALNLGKVVDGFYWKINGAKASSFTLASFELNDAAGPEAAFSVARGHILKNVTGIRSGKFPPKAPKGGCPDYCAATQWCWRYEAGYSND